VALDGEAFLAAGFFAAVFFAAGFLAVLFRIVILKIWQRINGRNTKIVVIWLTFSLLGKQQLFGAKRKNPQDFSWGFELSK
jgi:hypothetical protein